MIHFAFEILLLNARADKILTFANASKPFKSNFGLPGSAYPSFCAFFKTLSKVSLLFSISDKI